MGKKDLEKIKKSAFYQEIAKIHRSYFDILSPLSIALFGDAGYKEYNPAKLPIGSGIKKEMEDTNRSGVIYGIAILLSQGMSIDDILDPTKELEKKQEAGKLLIKLSKERKKEEILEIYEKATELMMEELSWDTKDNLLDNSKNIKNFILRKGIFDINQRFGEHLKAFDAMLEKRYKEKNEPNYKELAKERRAQIYSAPEYIQALQFAEMFSFEILKEEKPAFEIGNLICALEAWNLVKDKAKKVNKESEPGFGTEVYAECLMNYGTFRKELEDLKIDVEAYFAEALNTKNGLENLLENAKKFKEKELKKAEKRNQKTAEELEMISSMPDYRTIMDIRYNYNQVANEIGKSFYGDEAAREVAYGEDLNFVLDGIYNNGGFNLDASGISYAAAILLAEGMSLDIILDPSVESEAKKLAGERVKELAEQGEAGRREMALFAAKAMGILEKENYSEMSKNRDILENEANFKNNFAAQIMEDLKYETKHTLNLKEALEYQVKQDNPTFSAKEAAEKAEKEYKRVQSYGKSYAEVKSFHQLTENRMEIDFQKERLKQMYKELLEVDPGYIKSSPEFKNMRKSLEGILILHEDAAKYIRKYEEERKKENSPAAFDKAAFYQELSGRYAELEEFNNNYLNIKKDIKPKEGSNAYKRLNFAKKFKEFVQETKIEVNNKNKALNPVDKNEINKRYAEGREKVKNAIDRCYDMVSPYTKPNHKPASQKEEIFMQKCFAVKKEENNFKIPKDLNISEKQAGLLVLISLGTVEVGQTYVNDMKGYLDAEGKTNVSVACFAEDVFNMRERFEAEKMLLVEKGRSVVKNALDAYADGDKTKLASLLREGLKRYSFSYSNFKNGLENIDKVEFAYKMGSDIYNMISENAELKTLLSDKAYGPDKMTKETVESYRAATVVCEICEKAEAAKNALTDMNRLDTQKRKEALATLVLKNIIHTEFKNYTTAYGAKVDKYLEKKYREKDILEELNERAELIPETEEEREEQERLREQREERIEELDMQCMAETWKLGSQAPVSKFQRELTPEKVKLYLERLTNSKTIERMEKYMDISMLKKFEYEENFCGKVIETIMKEEASLFKVKEKEIQEEIDKQKAAEEVQVRL